MLTRGAIDSGKEKLVLIASSCEAVGVRQQLDSTPRCHQTHEIAAMCCIRDVTDQFTEWKRAADERGVVPQRRTKQPPPPRLRECESCGKLLAYAPLERAKFKS